MFFRAVAAFLIATPVLAADLPGAADHPAIGRIDGSEITAFETVDFDAQNMLVDVEERQIESFEGRVTRIQYTIPAELSTLQVRRSFEEKLTGEGFEVLASCDYDVCRKVGVGAMRNTVSFNPTQLGLDFDVLTLRREDDDGLIHAQILASPKWINVNVVESAAMENRAIDAVAVADTLAETGRMAFYDIHFATGAATLTDDSAATVALIAEVLAADPDLSIIVVGHTDNVGTLDANLALSRNRAQAVVDALTSVHGVAANRLVAAGVAFLAPVASNATEEGRALNRRVEIVLR